MTRIAAREIAVHTVYTLDFFTGDMDSLMEERADPAFYKGLAEEDEVFSSPPSPESFKYIETVTSGVSEHLAELDGYIEKYAVGWKFGRISRVVAAILRVCMFEVLYRPDIPDAAAINAAVELCKKYEDQQTASFANGILGVFVKKERN